MKSMRVSRSLQKHSVSDTSCMTEENQAHMQNVANKIAISGTTDVRELFWDAASSWADQSLDSRRVGRDDRCNDIHKRCVL